MPRKKKEEEDEGLVDFYKVIDKSLLTKYHNPHYEKHKITVPFYGILCGSTGAGKTQTLMNIIKKMNGTFSKLVLCAKSVDEPLYQHLIKKIDPDYLDIYQNGDVPSVDKYNDFNGQILVIFDDLVNLKNQQPIIEWFIRGRKIAGGCSMIYLTQSWYKTPKTIRIQCNHIFLKRMTSLRDLTMVISDYGLGSMKNDIIREYKKITNESKIPFFCIRTDTPKGERFSKNFLGFIDIDDGFGISK